MHTIRKSKLQQMLKLNLRNPSDKFCHSLVMSHILNISITLIPSHFAAEQGSVFLINMQLTPLRTSHSYSMCGPSSAREPGQLAQSWVFPRWLMPFPGLLSLTHTTTLFDTQPPDQTCLTPSCGNESASDSFANAEQLLCAHVFYTSSAVSSSNHGFFRCPEQLNRWPCPLLGLSVWPN